jgi:hypothetical protein
MTMAAPAAVIAAKVAVSAATDKRFRKILIGIFLGGIVLLLAPIALTISVLQSGGSMDLSSADFQAQLASGMTAEQQAKITQMGTVMDALKSEYDTQQIKCNFIKVQVFYLCLVYGKEAGSETFCADFISCFSGDKTDDEIVDAIAEKFGITVTDKEKQDAIMLANKAIDLKLMPPGYPGAPITDESFAALMKEARKHLGKPYVFGAAGPDSFDCSGFVCYVLNHSGVYPIGRMTAQGLYNICTPVDRADAKQGDLIFFQGTYSTSATVTHLGIYIGNDKMIHAGSPVQYADVNTSYWQQHYYAVGRLPTKSANK